MRNFKLYMLLAAALFLSTSCLDKYPEDAILADKAIKTADDVNQAVIGIYSAFQSSALYSGYLTLLPDIQSDFVYAVNGYSNTYGEIWRWDILSTDTNIESVYGALYGVIGRCNFLLDQVDGVRQSTTDDNALDQIDQCCGEVYFARALAYSELIKLYCKAYEGDEAAKNELGVVLKEHYNSEEPVVRSSLYDSYQLVLKDLDKAADYLKLEEGSTATLYNYPYFCEYTVYALRARVALYMKDYVAAMEYASKVIDSKKYSLTNANLNSYDSSLNDYQYMWSTDNSTEIIWKVGFTVNSYGGALGTVFFNYDFISYKPDYVPALWVINSYSDADLRASAFFTTLTTGYDHGLSWPLLAKYWGNSTFWNNNIPHVCMPKVFRLSEQYLIRAEAYCGQGDYNNAGKDITTLRNARYSTYGGSTTLTKDNWLETIEEERVKELYMEGFRLTDLKRWHKGFTREPQQESITSGSSLKVEADAPLFVWPIPRHELEAPGANIEPNESNK